MHFSQSSVVMPYHHTEEQAAVRPIVHVHKTHERAYTQVEWKKLEPKLSKALLVAVLVAATMPVLTSMPVAAHHSFALFDMTKSVALEGTVKSFEWTNPHSWVRLEVPGPQNTVSEWLIELPPAGVLAREGWNKNFVKAGDR